MELKKKNICVPERVSDLQDDNTVLLPFLAGSGRPKTTLNPLHLHRTCATGFGGLPTPRSSCCALQVWPSAWHFPSANTHEKKNAAIQVLNLSQQIKCWGVSGRPCACHALVQVWGGRGRLSHYCGWCSCAWGGSGLIFGQLWRICGYIECGWFRIWLASITDQENQHPPIKIHVKGFNGCIFIPLVSRLSTGPVHFCSPVSPPLALLENCSMVRNTHKSPKTFLKMHSTDVVASFAATCQFARQVPTTTFRLKPPAPGQREAGRGGGGGGGRGTSTDRRLRRTSRRAECSRS